MVTKSKWIHKLYKCRFDWNKYWDIFEIQKMKLGRHSDFLIFSCKKPPKFGRILMHQFWVPIQSEGEGVCPMIKPSQISAYVRLLNQVCNMQVLVEIDSLQFLTESDVISYYPNPISTFIFTKAWTYVWIPLLL